MPEGVQYLDIHDAHGRRLRRVASLPDGSLDLDTGALPRGLIFLSVWDGRERWQVRVILQ